MSKEFDFDDIGKRTPYRVPLNFFEEMQENVMQRTGNERPRSRRLHMVISTAITLAAVLAGFLFVPSFCPTDVVAPSSQNILAVEKNGATVETVDKWINELSDEELEELVSFSDNDIFLN